MKCTHKTMTDFTLKGKNDSGQTLWKCSDCKKRFTWVKGVSSYFGNLECKHCSTAAIESVHCGCKKKEAEHERSIAAGVS